MSDSPTRYDKGGNAQIAVPENKCGCVYEMQMGFTATTGLSTYSANTMKVHVSDIFDNGLAQYQNFNILSLTIF
jgi:hypothetical protein